MHQQHGFGPVGIILVILSLGIVGSGGWYAWSKNQVKPPRPGLVKVDRYVYNEPNAVVCQAFVPECGECFGEVIDKECWVNPDELSDSDKRIMGI